MKTFTSLSIALITVGLLFPFTAVASDVPAASFCNTKCQVGQLQAPTLAGNFTLVNFGGVTCQNTVIVAYTNYGTLPAVNSNMTITISWTTTICGTGTGQLTLGPISLGNIPGRTISMFNTGPEPIPPDPYDTVNVTFHWS